MFLVGLLFLIVGYVVVFTRPEGVTQRMFGWFGLMAMLSAGLSVVILPTSPGTQWMTPAILVAFFFGRIFGPPAFLLFFLQFPIRRRILDKPWFYVALHLAAMALVLPFVGVLGKFVALPMYARAALGSLPNVFTMSAAMEAAIV